MQIPRNWSETWFIVQQRKTLEFTAKEACKFSNSWKWVWWTDYAAFGWQFICSVCSCRAKRHQLFFRNWSWHFNCWGVLTGDQLLGEQIGSSFCPFRFLRERLRRGEAMPGPRQSDWCCFQRHQERMPWNGGANSETLQEERKGSKQDSWASF